MSSGTTPNVSMRERSAASVTTPAGDCATSLRRQCEHLAVTGGEPRRERAADETGSGHEYAHQAQGPAATDGERDSERDSDGNGVGMRASMPQPDGRRRGATHRVQLATRLRPLRLAS